MGNIELESTEHSVWVSFALSKLRRRVASVTRIVSVLLGLVIAATVSNPSNAEGIKLFGVNWSMELSEIQSTFASRGYPCEEGEPMFCGELGKGIQIVEGNMIVFTCAVFDVCEVSLKDVAQSLVDNEIVGTLRHERFQYGGDYKSRYCGGSGQGDKLCVFGNAFSNEPLISMVKGTFGKGSAFE